MPTTNAAQDRRLAELTRRYPAVAAFPTAEPDVVAVLGRDADGLVRHVEVLDARGELVDERLAVEVLGRERRLAQEAEARATDAIVALVAGGVAIAHASSASGLSRQTLTTRRTALRDVAA